MIVKALSLEKNNFLFFGKKNVEQELLDSSNIPSNVRLFSCPIAFIGSGNWSLMSTSFTWNMVFIPFYPIIDSSLGVLDWIPITGWIKHLILERFIACGWLSILVPAPWYCHSGHCWCSWAITDVPCKWCTDPQSSVLVSLAASLWLGM